MIAIRHFRFCLWSLAPVALGVGFPAASEAITINTHFPVQDFVNVNGNIVTCDQAFEGLKGNSNVGSVNCTPAAIQEWWVANSQPSTGDTTRQRITKWDANNASEIPVTQCNQAGQACTSWSLGVAKPFTINYTQSTGLVQFTLDGNPQQALLPPSIRGNPVGSNPIPLINELYVRAASPNCPTGIADCSNFRIELTDISFASTPTGLVSIPNLIATAPAAGQRQVRYHTITGLPQTDWSINGNATVFGTVAGNWQFKTAYRVPNTPVPGPLPLAGGLAAFGWSRRLRRRVRLKSAD